MTKTPNKHKGYKILLDTEEQVNENISSQVKKQTINFLTTKKKKRENKFYSLTCKNVN